MRLWMQINYGNRKSVKGVLKFTQKPPQGHEFTWESTKPDRFIEGCLTLWDNPHHVEMWKKHGYEGIEDFYNILRITPLEELGGLETTFRTVERELQKLASKCTEYYCVDEDAITSHSIMLGYTYPSEIMS